MTSAFEDRNKIQHAAKDNYQTRTDAQWMALMIRRPKETTSQIIWQGQRVEYSRHTPGARSNPTPRYIGKQHQRKSHCQPRQTVLVTLTCVTDIAVGRGKSGKKRHPDRETAQSTPA